MTLRHRTEQRYRNSVRAVEVRGISIPRYQVSRSFGCHNENWRLQGANFGHQFYNVKFESFIYGSVTSVVYYRGGLLSGGLLSGGLLPGGTEPTPANAGTAFIATMTGAT